MKKFKISKLTLEQVKEISKPGKIVAMPRSIKKTVKGFAIVIRSAICTPLQHHYSYAVFPTKRDAEILCDDWNNSRGGGLKVVSCEIVYALPLSVKKLKK